MKTSYSNAGNAPSRRVNELPSVSATLLKNSYAEVLDQVSENGAVAVTRHNKPRAVLLSVKDYEALLHAAPDPLLEMKHGKITAPSDLSQAPDWAKPIVAAAIKLHRTM